MKILVCGLPGSGKTWLAERLVKSIDNCAWFNADFVRKAANDWNFDMPGRIRQAKRMKTYADFEKKNGRFVICDFVAPTQETRDEFKADYIVWLDTIKTGRFQDTNKIFQQPNKFDVQIKKFLSDDEIFSLGENIKSIYLLRRYDGLEKTNCTNAR